VPGHWPHLTRPSSPAAAPSPLGQAARRKPAGPEVPGEQHGAGNERGATAGEQGPDTSQLPARPLGPPATPYEGLRWPGTHRPCADLSGQAHWRSPPAAFASCNNASTSTAGSSPSCATSCASSASSGVDAISSSRGNRGSSASASDATLPPCRSSIN